MLDKLAEYLARRKGLLPLLGLLLVVANFAFQFFPGLGAVRDLNILLHAGIFLAVFGLLLAQAL